MEIQVEQLIKKIAKDLDTLIKERNVTDPVFIGVRTGGVWIAQRLCDLMQISSELNILDINFYRDDFSRIGLSPQVKPSDIKSNIDNRHVILIDDILQTGRTTCAALNEIGDYGRAATITFVVLIDRAGREIPINADVCGMQISLDANQQIKLRGPDPLYVETINL